MDIKNYTDLITSQHHDKPNFITWLTSALSKIKDGTDATDSIVSAFDIDIAVGVQLDILGIQLGVNRVVNFQPTGGTSPVLDDDTYKLCLKAKIAINQWDGTTPSVYSLWSTLFPTSRLIIADNQDMSINAIVFSLNTQIQKDLIAHGYIIPKPEGVFMTYTFASDILFAYDTTNSNFAGYDSGSWL